MSWDYNISSRALKELKKLGYVPSQQIINFLDERIRNAEDPRVFGKSLKGDLGEYWRYRIGDYRLLCELKDRELIVLVVKAGHRRDVYD